MKYELEVSDELKCDLKIVLHDEIENCKYHITTMFKDRPISIDYLKGRIKRLEEFLEKLGE